MQSSRPMTALLLGLLALPLAAQEGTGSAEAVDYFREVRPILTQHCYGCHGPDEDQRATDLRFDRRENAFADLGGGTHAIVAGDLQASELWARISSDDPDEKMPPPDEKDALSPAETEILRRWIEQGASWSDHWAFQPIERPEVPKSGEGWALNPIDRFVAARLEKEGLGRSGRASKAELIRRVTFDLTGLPPTPEEIDAFLEDDRPDAWDRLVRRLLDSPRYGERQAQDWLDVARYADSNGYQADGGRSAWKWREWVIEAFNRNMPFDRFTIEQLAGDLLDEPTLAQLVATGFNRNHSTNSEAGSEPDEYRSQYVIDRVDTTSTAFLGLTLACAQCHDHKFDPLSQEDFYSFYAFFNQIDESEGGGRNARPSMRVPNPDQAPHYADVKRRIEELKKRLEGDDPLADAAQASWEERARAHVGDEPEWKTAEPVGFFAQQGSMLKLLDDGSILARGEAPVRDVYDLTFRPGKSRISAIRLEVLPHESQPEGASGRSRKGQFILSGLKIRVSSLSDAQDPPLVFVSEAQADIEQERPEEFEPDGMSPGDISGSIVVDDSSNEDGNSFDFRGGGRGWSVMGDARLERHEAVIVPLETLDLNDSSVVRITLEQTSRPFKSLIGRFRISFVDDDGIRELMLPAQTKLWSSLGPFPAADVAKAFTTDFEPEKDYLAAKAVDRKKTYVQPVVEKKEEEGRGRRRGPGAQGPGGAKPAGDAATKPGDDGKAPSMSKPAEGAPKAAAAAGRTPEPKSPAAGNEGADEAAPEGQDRAVGKQPGPGAAAGQGPKKGPGGFPGKGKFGGKGKFSGKGKPGGPGGPGKPGGAGKPAQDSGPGVAALDPQDAEKPGPGGPAAKPGASPASAEAPQDGKPGEKKPAGAKPGAVGEEVAAGAEEKPESAEGEAPGEGGGQRGRRREPPRLSWEEQRTWRDGSRIRIQAADAAYYLTRKIVSTRARTVKMSFDGPDGVKVWLNGEVVFEDAPKAASEGQGRRGGGFGGRGGSTSSDRELRLGLREGENELVVKVVYAAPPQRGGRRGMGGGDGGEGEIDPALFANADPEEVQAFLERRNRRNSGSFVFGFRPEGEDVLTHEVVTALRALSDDGGAALVTKRNDEGDEEKATAREERLRKVLRKHYRRNHDTVGSILAEQLEVLEREKSDLERKMPETLVMKEVAPEKMRKTHVFVRGDYRDKGAEVEAGVPGILVAMGEDLPRNRLGLAKWIVSEDNPLTARVQVNRIWQQYFGTGLVRTAEDFGVRSEAPTHPELLDWLAREFIESGWDLKHVHRLIVGSATYRQSSQVAPEDLETDPENRLLARGPRLRLTAEMIRDNALAAAGLLVHEIGGESVRPFQPAGIWSEVAGQRYRKDRGEDQYRRGLYVYWKRGSPYPSMITFDAAKREVCTVTRAETTTPLQALVLLNDPVFVEAAKMFGQRMLEEGGDDDAARVAWGYRVATSRAAGETEIGILTSLLAEQRRHYEGDLEAAKKLLAIGDAKVNEKHAPAEMAAWASVASALLNMDATIHR